MFLSNLNSPGSSMMSHRPITLMVSVVLTIMLRLSFFGSDRSSRNTNVRPGKTCLEHSIWLRSSSRALKEHSESTPTASYRRSLKYLKSCFARIQTPRVSLGPGSRVLMTSGGIGIRLMRCGSEKRGWRSDDCVLIMTVEQGKDQM